LQPGRSGLVRAIKSVHIEPVVGVKVPAGKVWPEGKA
jgi:hypothetical protein